MIDKTYTDINRCIYSAYVTTANNTDLTSVLLMALLTKDNEDYSWPQNHGKECKCLFCSKCKIPFTFVELFIQSPIATVNAGS